MKYTFLLPAYKAAYFAEALESIKHQTYEDFNVLVSDDCSPEDLRAIFDAVVGLDSRFTYRRNAENMGSKSLVSHWNLLVDMCDTEYLIMASDDDVYEPTFLEEIDKLVQRYPDVGILRAKARRLEDGKPVAEDGDIPELLNHEEFLLYFGVKPMVHCLANYVFHTSALKEMGGFPDFPTAAKSDTATAMFLSKNGLATTSKILFSFRISKENLSSDLGYQRNCEKTLVANLLFTQWYQTHILPLIQPKTKTAIYSINRAYIENIVHYLICRLSFKGACLYYIRFYRQGLFHGIKPFLTFCKNYVFLWKDICSNE